MKHIILGTAGHVDHGKTALVKALSGQDTDKLKEEKARGISIDLGFAHLPLTDQIDVSIVDVPGHERFLKNMLAGAGGVDIALLIIAADEGIMPQTIEHLSMLDSYGVKAGLTVLTKIDKVDVDWLELVEEEIRTQTAGTFLEGSSILPVSSITGEGIERLRASILTLAEKTTGRDESAPFRLWIDRVFTVKGHGAVVTGSILSGSIKTGQILLAQPLGMNVKARGLETHGKAVDQASAGQRVAINVSGIESKLLGRGVLLTSPERSDRNRIWDIAADWRQSVKSGTRVRVHIGTGEWIGRVRIPRWLPAGIVRISLERELAGGCGERGIVRLYSPQTLIGGMTLVAPAGRFLPAAPAALADAVISNDIGKWMSTIIAHEKKPQKVSEVLRACGYYPEADCVQQIADMEASGALLRSNDSVLGTSMASRLAEQLIQRLQQLEDASATKASMPKAEAKQYVGLDDKWFDRLLEAWRQDGLVEVVGSVVALPGFTSETDARQTDIRKKLELELGDEKLRQIDCPTLAGIIGSDLSSAKPVYDNLLRIGELVRLGEVVVYRKTLQYNVIRIQEFLRVSDTATAAQLRDLLAVSRKMAIPVLEYCDMNKYTVRQGDLRRIGPRIAVI